jgi:LacI family transcriptional regulator
MATLRDVAAFSGVSPSTASRVINAQPVSVSPETRRRILQAAEALRYRPNAHAQSLRLRTSSTVGVLVPGLENPFFAELLAGVRAAAAEAGYFVLLGDTVEEVEAEHAYARLLREKRVDGLVIATAGYDDAIVAELRQQRFPFVLVSRPALGAEDRFVGSDDFAGARLAVRRLIDLGHRRIAHLSGPLFAGSALRRLQGYRAALEEGGLPFAEGLVVEARFDEEGGLRAMRRLLDAGRGRPTAVFAASDAAALGALRACEEAGLAVPGDVSLIGYNDISVAARVRPRLTTVRLPLAEAGRAAFHVLLRLMRGQAPGGPVVFPPELVLRESDGPPAG